MHLLRLLLLWVVLIAVSLFGGTRANENVASSYAEEEQGQDISKHRITRRANLRLEGSRPSYAITTYMLKNHDSQNYIIGQNAMAPTGTYIKICLTS